MPDMGTCKACGQEILWCKTVNDKLMPVNPTPVPNGNLELKDGKALYVKPDPDVARHVSHYANCHAAKTFRKEEKKQEGGK